MATLRRSHAPAPWGAQVEQMEWKRSRPGKPKRRRSDRPALIHDPGWEWDGTRVLFSETGLAPDHVEEAPVSLVEDAQVFGRIQTSLSLLDVARYQATKRCSKARSGLDDFEVIRVPNVVPVSEEEPRLWDSWDWERLDDYTLGFKRTYSEVAQGLDDKRKGCARLSAPTQDDAWEYL